MSSIIQWIQIQGQRQLQWQRQWQRQKKFQEEWVNVFRFKFPLWMFIGWLRCPLLMTMFTSIQRQRQRQRQIQGQRQSQSSENTRHMLYFRKAEGARIPNMIFLSWWRRQGLGRPGGQRRQGGQRGQGGQGRQGQQGQQGGRGGQFGHFRHFSTLFQTFPQFFKLFQTFLIKVEFLVPSCGPF